MHQGGNIFFWNNFCLILEGLKATRFIQIFDSGPLSQYVKHDKDPSVFQP